MKYLSSAKTQKQLHVSAYIEVRNQQFRKQWTRLNKAQVKTMDPSPEHNRAATEIDPIKMVLQSCVTGMAIQLLRFMYDVKVIKH